uniref:Uncharacterized protein n=1 Tax=mine drainage metagenome TaxID=410659 RepID=E6PWW3_9ZZZZ
MRQRQEVQEVLSGVRRLQSVAPSIPFFISDREGARAVSVGVLTFGENAGFPPMHSTVRVMDGAHKILLTLDMKTLQRPRQLVVRTSGRTLYGTLPLVLCETDEAGFEERFDCGESVEDIGVDGFVHLNDGERFHGVFRSCFAAAFSSQSEVGDVDALLPENRTDVADDAGDVEVAADEEGSFEGGFDVNGVEREQARLFAVEDGARGLAGAGAVMNGDGEHVGGASARGGFLFLVEPDAALLGDGVSIDAIDIV